LQHRRWRDSSCIRDLRSRLDHEVFNFHNCFQCRPAFCEKLSHFRALTDHTAFAQVRTPERVTSKSSAAEQVLAFG